MYRDNFLKKLPVLIFLGCFLLIAASGCGGDRKWKRDPETGKYTYPITISSPEWKTMSHAELVEVCRIPDYVLEDITDEELVELVFQYPFLTDAVYAWSTFRMGVEYVAEGLPQIKTILEDGTLRAYVEQHTDEDGNIILPDVGGNFESIVLEYIKQGLAYYP